MKRGSNPSPLKSCLKMNSAQIDKTQRHGAAEPQPKEPAIRAYFKVRKLKVRTSRRHAPHEGPRKKSSQTCVNFKVGTAEAQRTQRDIGAERDLPSGKAGGGGDVLLLTLWLRLCVLCASAPLRFISAWISNVRRFVEARLSSLNIQLPTRGDDGERVVHALVAWLCRAAPLRLKTAVDRLRKGSVAPPHCALLSSSVFYPSHPWLRTFPRFLLPKLTPAVASCQHPRHSPASASSTARRRRARGIRFIDRSTPCAFRHENFTSSTLEPLGVPHRSRRDAPVTYTDIDGDRVKITDSSGNLTTADLVFLGGGTSGQLAKLNLFAPAFNGASITLDGDEGQNGRWARGCRAHRWRHEQLRDHHRRWRSQRHYVRQRHLAYACDQDAQRPFDGRLHR